MTQGPKCLVIDTDIASSAGGADTKDVRSKSCRDFLIVVRNSGHKIVTTIAIRAEWHRHQSSFTRTWLRSMIARKRVCWIDVAIDDELRSKIENIHQNKRQAIQRDMQHAEFILKTEQNRREILLKDMNRIQGKLVEEQNKHEAMLKDIHLIEAALQADRIVISMDETVRQYFHEATQSINALKQIAWVNPCKSEETPIEWLQSGAEPEKERLLGYHRENSES